MRISDICNMDAGAIARAVRTKELSAVEATKAALARMDALEPEVQVFCTPTPELADECAGR